MKHLVKVQFLALTLFTLVSGVFGATVVATPNQVPRGAYVNGSSGEDMQWMQILTITLDSGGAAAWASADDIVVTLAPGITIAQVDETATYANHIYVAWDDESGGAGVGLTTVGLGAVTASSITVDITVGVDVQPGNEIILIFPVETDSTTDGTSVDYSVSFPATKEAVDGPVTGAVTFRDSLYVTGVALGTTWFTGGDQSSTKGDVYPTANANLHEAYGNLVIDNKTAAGILNAPTVWGDLTLNGTDNDATTADYDEPFFQIWASQTDNLTKVSTQEGHKPVLDDITVMLPLEEGTIATSDRYDGTRFAEGNWYFYITSTATSDWVLASSDSVDIRHWPTFAADDAAGGLDYDNDGTYEPGAAGQDNVADTYLESGGTIGKDGTLATANLGDADFFWSFEDVDDNATIQIFKSTQDGLTVDSVTVTGSEPNEVVTGIGSASTQLNSTTIYEEGSTGSFNYDIYTDAIIFETAGSFYIYYVVNDGKNQQIYQLQTNGAAADKRVIVKHYPYFAYDDVYLVDGYAFDTANDEYLVISWGSDINNDNDADGDATIKFYLLDEATYANGLNTVGLLTGDVLDALSATELAAAATYLGSTTENADTKVDNRFMYDLAGSGLAAGGYVIVTHIQDGADNLLVQYEDDGAAPFGPIPKASITAGNDRTITLAHGQYASGTYTPQSGETVTLNGEDEFQFDWNFYDKDDVAANYVAIYMAPTTADPFTTGDSYDEITADLAGAGDIISGYFWLSNPAGDGSAQQAAAAGPLAETGKFTLDVSTLATDLEGNAGAPSGFYNVYYLIAWDGTLSNEPATQAPGVIRFTGSSATLNDFRLTPNKSVLVKGDTIDIDVYVESASALNVRLLNFNLDVPDTYFTVVDQGSGAPFNGETANLNGTVIENSMTQTGGYWQLSYAEKDDTPSEALNGGSGQKVADFQVVVSAAASGTEHIEQLIEFVDSGTRLSNIIDAIGNEEFSTIASPAARILVSPPGWLEGQIDLELIADSSETVDIHVNPRGSYTPITDADFLSANGGANADGSVTVTLGTDGAYTVSSIPTGDYDVYVKKSGYLDRSSLDVQIRPATPTTVNFTGVNFLYAGDIAGHDDDDDNATFEIGDNQIETADITAVSNAYGATSADANWNPAADLDGDGTVYATDYITIVRNDGTNGDGLLYKGFDPAATNNGAVARLIALSETGSEITYALEVDGLNSLSAFNVEMAISGDWDVIDYSDGLASFGRSHLLEYVSGHTFALVSGLTGRKSIYSENAELFTLTLQAKVADPEPVEVTEVNLYDANGSMSQAIVSGDVLPTEFALEQNYPNPFNPSTTISFSLPVAGDVHLAVYNLLGQEVASLVTGSMDAGNYTAVWNALDGMGRKVSSGMYFYRLTVDNKTIATKKMVMLK